MALSEAIGRIPGFPGNVDNKSGQAVTDRWEISLRNSKGESTACFAGDIHMLPPGGLNLPQVRYPQFGTA